MTTANTAYDTLIIGGGQAGLVTAYYLKQQGHEAAILEANERIGDSWRKRWDSLRLFTPARYSTLPGMRFPAPARYFPTKDEMADYLEHYSQELGVPIHTGTRVKRLKKHNGSFQVETDDQQYEANRVIVAMANYQYARIPEFAAELNPDIMQMHAVDYRNPSQLRDGDALVVGAGNSGAEIALELARSRKTWLAGKYPGYIPFRIETRRAHYLFIPFVLRFLFHRVLTVHTPIGRKARKKMLHGAGPLVRTKPSDIEAAGIERVPRLVGVRDGLPLLEDGRTLNTPNIIWCTGFQPHFEHWIDLPIFDEQGDPRHERGVVHEVPGLYFVGLHFQTAVSSAQIHGVSRDAAYISQRILAQ